MGLKGSVHGESAKERIVAIIKVAITGIGEPSVELAALPKQPGHVGRPKPPCIIYSLGIDGLGGEDLLPGLPVGRTLKLVTVARQQIQVAFPRVMQVEGVNN
jgi:hypothetical protein